MNYKNCTSIKNQHLTGSTSAHLKKRFWPFRQSLRILTRSLQLSPGSMTFATKKTDMF